MGVLTVSMRVQFSTKTRLFVRVLSHGRTYFRFSHKFKIDTANNMKLFVLLSTLCISTVAFSPKNLPKHTVTPASSLVQEVDLSTVSGELPVLESTGAPLVTEFPPPTLMLNGKKLSTWARRLNTKQDQFSVHKFARLGWAASFGIMTTFGLTTGFSCVPAWMEPVTHLFLISTAIQAISSYPMTIKYRSNDPVVKNGFLNAINVSVINALIGFWLGPFCQDWLGHDVLPFIIMFLVALDTSHAIHITWTRDEIEKNALGKSVAERKEATSYLIAITWIPQVLQLLLLSLMLPNIMESREFLLQNGLSSEMSFYLNTLASGTVSFVPLLTTLEHKKLIDKETALRIPMALAALMIPLFALSFVAEKLC